MLSVLWVQPVWEQCWNVSHRMTAGELCAARTSLEQPGSLATVPVTEMHIVGGSSEAVHLLRNTAMDDSIGGS